MKKFPLFKSLNIKQLIGVIAIVLGVALLVFASYQKHRVSAARGDVDNISRYFPKNPFTAYGEKSVHEKLDGYDKQILWCFIISGILIVGGGYVTYRFRKPRS